MYHPYVGGKKSLDQVMWCHFAKIVTSLYVYENSDPRFGPDKLKFVDISDFFSVHGFKFCRHIK